jgi:3-deoxy-7-phosphoheptulonate synthase
MIIVLKPGATEQEIFKLTTRIRKLGLHPHVSRGKERTVIPVIGDDRVLAQVPLLGYPFVEKVMPVLAPYKLVSRESRRANTVVRTRGLVVGGRRIALIAGPCSVESSVMILKIARAVKRAGAGALRGGAFKPRTSPYSFQGLGEEGLRYLAQARAVTGLAVVTEVLDTRHVELVARYADVLQVGARNMQNYELLKEVGMARLPVLFKRGLSATLNEYLQAAEYILSRGNDQVILCERGIRAVEDHTRNTFDLNAIPVLKELTHLPVIADPSQATGKASYVAAVSRGAIAAGADGLILEVHDHPEEAVSDGEQSILPSRFAELVRSLRPVARSVGRAL